MNFIETFFEQLKSKSSTPFLIEVRGKALVPHTGAELSSLIGSVRSALKEHGVQVGDRVALLASNSAKWAACDLALLASGAVSVPLYSRQEPKELAVILKDCSPKLLIVSDDELRMALTAVWKPTCDLLTFNQIFSGPVEKQAPASVSPNSPVTIVYTSGTSGEPKGVVLTTANVDFMLERTLTSLKGATGRATNEDKVFHFLPLCFLGSRLMFWTQLLRGNPVLMSTDLKNLVEEMGAAQPQFFLTVPAVLDRIRNAVTEKLRERGGLIWKIFTSGGFWARLLVYPKIRERIGANLEFVICGSAPLSAETQEWFARLGISILQVYGLTETTGIVTMDTKENVKAGYVGKAVKGCEIKVSDEGELLVRGPNVFPGYWNKPEATSAMVKDGWLYTGDQAEVDSEGRVKILGRLKNILVPASGHNIAPEPIEQQVVESVTGAEHAFVVGHGRPYLALLITGEIRENELSHAIDELNRSLPHYRKIRKFRRVDEKFTIENGLLTANQKMRRKVIENHFQPVIEAMYREGAGA
jgi:long-chain acyl-CoA synthetase